MHSPLVHVEDQSRYRPDIDGLRAIAVLSVLLFHLGASGFSGGFVGVDVFFVISGFLITGMITRDLERERFNLWRFYARRGRRLLPAMLAVIALSGIAAFLMLSPEHLISYAKSAVASVFLVSNFVFWQEAGYFDLAGRMKPLLHLWTLSLEWQFYAIWPAVLAFAVSGRERLSAPISIAAIGFLSLLAGSLLKVDPSTVFYQMPFRVFEFAIGALLIWIPALKRKPLAELCCLAGLALIAFSIVKFDGKAFYGSPAMLVPTIGAALLIIGGQDSLSGRIVGNPLAAYIGRISYSVYLVHWPLIVFTEYFNFSPLNRDQTIGIFAASIILGSALYHLLEKPIHTQGALKLTPSYAAPMLTGVVAFAVALPSLLAVPDGLSWRIDRDALKFEFSQSKVPSEILGYFGCKEPCWFGIGNGPKVLVFGDSHVDHFTKVLHKMGGDRYSFYYAGSASCFNGATLSSRSPNYPAITESCQKARKTLLEWVTTAKFDAVIVGQRWLAYFEALYRGDERLPKFHDKTVLANTMLNDIGALLEGHVAGPVIISGWAPATNAACYTRPSYLSMPCPNHADDGYGPFPEAAAAFIKRTRIRAHFVNVLETICPAGKCKVADDQGHILYTDSDHLSIYGAGLVVPQFLAIIDRAMSEKAARP